MFTKIETAPAKPEILDTDSLDHAMWATALFENEFNFLEAEANEAIACPEGRILIELVSEDPEVFDLVTAFGTYPGDWITFADYRGDQDPGPQAQAVYMLLVERTGLKARRTDGAGLPDVDDDAFGTQCQLLIQRIKTRLANRATE